MARQKDSAPVPDQEPHPLEGKYLVFSYDETEGDYQETFLALYRFTNGNLERIVGALNFGSGDPDALDEKTLAFLKSKNVTSVATVFFIGEDFFGVPANWVATQDPDEWEEPELVGDKDFVEVDSFGLRELSSGDRYDEWLRSNGIIVEYFTRNQDGSITQDEPFLDLSN